MMLSTWRIAPALATGNTVILKPAEWSPLTAWKLAQIFQEADLPPGVFNVVQGFGEEAGAPLVAHPLVPLITLTGETTTGSIVMKAAADQLKRLSLELGGKSPAVISPTPISTAPSTPPSSKSIASMASAAQPTRGR